MINYWEEQKEKEELKKKRQGKQITLFEVENKNE